MMCLPFVAKSLYLINARAKCASYFGAEVFAHSGFSHAQGIADLAAVTIAGFAPAQHRNFGKGQNNPIFQNPYKDRFLNS